MTCESIISSSRRVLVIRWFWPHVLECFRFCSHVLLSSSADVLSVFWDTRMGVWGKCQKQGCIDGLAGVSEVMKGDATRVYDSKVVNVVYLFSVRGVNLVCIFGGVCCDDLETVLVVLYFNCSFVCCSRACNMC